jgi:hypothetical protein
MLSVLLKVSIFGAWLIAALSLRCNVTLSAASFSSGQTRLEQEVLLVEVVVVGLMELHHGVEVEPMVRYLASGIGRRKAHAKVYTRNTDVNDGRSLCMICDVGELPELAYPLHARAN